DDDVVVVVSQLRVVLEYLAGGNQEPAPAVDDVARIRRLGPPDGQVVAGRRSVAVESGEHPPSPLLIPLDLGVAAAGTGVACGQGVQPCLTDRRAERRLVVDHDQLVYNL